MIRTWIFALLAASGIAVAWAPSEAAGQQRGANRSVQLIVDNQGFYDMHVYVVDGGMRRSLGLVTGLSRRTVTLPDVVVDSHRNVRILANAIAGYNDYLSPSLAIGPGDWVTVILRSNPNLSYTSVSARGPATDRPRSPEPPSDDPDSSGDAGDADASDGSGDDGGDPDSDGSPSN